MLESPDPSAKDVGEIRQTDRQTDRQTEGIFLTFTGTSQEFEP
jgi:hypothetical protein